MSFEMLTIFAVTVNNSAFDKIMLKESTQKIVVLRENLTSYTNSLIIPNQTKPVLRERLITLLSHLRLGDKIHVRVDGQSALSSLRSDNSLAPLGIVLETGLPKNVNKNAVVDKAIRELRDQLVRLAPQGGKISQATLARATDSLNSLIRHSGRSAKELWLSRDQASGCNLQLDDKKLYDLQFNKRQVSHSSSAKYAARNGKPASIVDLKVGDTVFIKSERSKSKARDSFCVLDLDEQKKLAKLQKFPMSNSAITQF